jgi:hypothetical protein
MDTIATLLFVPVVFSFMHRRTPVRSKADDSSAAAALATAHPMT